MFERKYPRGNLTQLLLGDEEEKGKKKFFHKKKKDVFKDKNFNKLFEEAVKKDREEAKDESRYENMYDPSTLLYKIEIPCSLSGLYIRIITNPEKFDAKSILIKRFNQLKKSVPDAMQQLGEEISQFTLRSDLKFAKIASSTQFLISTGFSDLGFSIQNELKISSDQRLTYLEFVLHEKIFWTPEQLSVMKNSHIRFLKKEFLDIILLMNEQAVTYAFDYFNYIIENQIKQDKARIDLMFKEFFMMIEKKKKTTLLEMKSEMKKSSQYILKERENLKEIKIALEVGQDLESLIPQDF